MISPTPSHPQDQGNRRRIYEICKAFQSDGYLVHFIWYAHEWGGVINETSLIEMQEMLDYLHIVPINPSRQNYKKVGAGNSLDEFWTDSISHMIQWCQLNFDFDFVWINYVLYSKACLPFKKDSTVTLIDTHDVLGQRFDLLGDENVEQQFYSLTQEEENKGLKRADIVVAIQDEEATYFKEQGLPRVVTVGHGQSDVSFSPLYEGSNTVGLIGSNNIINLENYKRLVAALDEARQKLSDDFRLIVAGTMSNYLPEPVPDYVQTMGRIQDVASFYCKVNVALIPLEFGSGLKIKAVEALSYGVPIMATAHAFTGITTQSNYHKYQTISDLVNNLPALLFDPKEIDNLREISRSSFKQYQEIIASQFAELYVEIKNVHKHKARSYDVYSPSTSLDSSSEIYIYGAGIGGQYLYNNMSKNTAARVVGFIDLYKTGQELLGLPIVHYDDIPAGKRKGATLILTLTNSEWKKMYDKLVRSGFSRVKTAHQYIINGIVSFD